MDNEQSDYDVKNLVFEGIIASVFYILCPLSWRFRSGFRKAFQWCPFVKICEEDNLELQHMKTFHMRRSYRTETASVVVRNHVNELEDTISKLIKAWIYYV